MTDQLQITGDARTLVDGKPLTDRQQLVWDHLRTAYDGIAADEAGALVHEYNRRHTRDERCEWCTATGRGVLTSKGLRRLVIRKRGDGLWRPRNPTDGQAAHSPQEPRGGQSGWIPY